MIRAALTLLVLLLLAIATMAWAAGLLDVMLMAIGLAIVLALLRPGRPARR